MFVSSCVSQPQVLLFSRFYCSVTNPSSCVCFFKPSPSLCASLFILRRREAGFQSPVDNVQKVSLVEAFLDDLSPSMNEFEPELIAIEEANVHVVPHHSKQRRSVDPLAKNLYIRHGNQSTSADHDEETLLTGRSLKLG